MYYTSASFHIKRRAYAGGIVFGEINTRRFTEAGSKQEHRTLRQTKAETNF